MKLLRFLCVVAVVILGSTVARAEPSLDPDLEVAQRHFERGVLLYDQRNYEGAIGEFKLAQQARPAPEFDYNIGRCYDRMERREAAIVAYTRFVAAEPESAHVAEVRERIRALATRQPPIDPEAVETTVRSRAAWVPHAPEPFRRRYGAATGVGVGALVLGLTATGLIASVVSPYRALANGQCDAGCPSSRYHALEARADAAYGVFALAGAAVIIDFALWIRAVRAPR